MRIFLAFAFAFIIGVLLVIWQPDATPVISDAPDLSLSAFAGCAADTDCKLVDLPCGETGAASQNRQRYVQDWYNDHMARMRCPLPVVPPRAPHRAACIDSICTAIAVPPAEAPPHVP